MELSERSEEILETLWVRAQEPPRHAPEAVPAGDDPALAALLELGLAERSAGGVSPTARGLEEGAKVVRRHRLAERLFADVLDLRADQVHPLSCRFEHLLHDGIEDHICVLLGHPATCPHGRPIPPGPCCREGREQAGRIVAPLSELPAGSGGKVAYLRTQDRDKLQKLMAMGVLPGTTIRVIQRSPSHVFSLGRSQFAVDRPLAESIFVRRGNE
jgi:DtxR family transcriptional regulator, Mn-dependent transcriptional regulator